MRADERKALLEAVRSLEQYQAVYEDRADLYGDVARAVGGLKGDFQRVLEMEEQEVEKAKKKER